MDYYNVIVSGLAELDLTDIEQYFIETLSEPAVAVKMLESIYEAFEGLSFMPRRYPPASGERLDFLGYRMLHVKCYIAFFTIDENTVTIERILHERRDWGNIL